MGLAVVLIASAGSAGAGPSQGPPLDRSTSTSSTTTTTTATTATTSTTTTTVPSTTVLAVPPAVVPVPGEDPSSATTSTSAPDAGPEEPLIGDELPPEQIDLITRYREIQRVSSDLLTQLSMLEGGLASAEADIERAEAELVEIEARRRDAGAQLAESERELEVERARLRERAVAAYIGGSLGAGAETAILSSVSIDEVGVSRAYENAVVADDHQLIDRTARSRDQVDRLIAEIDADGRAAIGVRDDLVTRRAELERQRDESVATEAQYAAMAQSRVELLSEAAQLQVLIEAGYARVQAVRDSIANTLASAQTGQTPPDRTLGLFLSPLPSPRINQPFGNQFDPIFGVARGHPGIDMNGSTGDPLRAAESGVVVAAGWIDGYGNTVIIDHGNTLGTLYAHQSLIAVKEGDQVRRGTIIGFVGSTGYSTGPHLHWEVRVMGQVVDPAPFIGEQR